VGHTPLTFKKGEKLKKVLMVLTALVMLALSVNPVMAVQDSEIQRGLEVSNWATESTTLTISHAKHDGYWDNSAGATWANIYAGNVSRRITDGSANSIGFSSTTTTNNFSVYIGYYTFDTSSISSGSIIVSMKLRLRIKSADNSGGQNGLYYSAYKMFPIADQVNGYATANEMYNWKNKVIRVSSVEDQSDYEVGDWVEFNILEGQLNSTLNLNKKYNTFAVMSTYLGMNSTPTWVSSQHHRVEMYAQTDGAGYEPELYIEYIDAAPNREQETEIIIEEYLQNSNPDTDTDGSETLDTVEWYTPRCAFEDESIAFQFTGTSGAIIEASLVNKNGEIITRIKDSIRANGLFNWVIKPEGFKAGLYRVVCDENLKSKWGYIAPRPDTGWNNQETLAKWVDYPHYEKTQGEMMVLPDEIFPYYYKTDLEADDITDFSFQLWANGENTEPVFEATLEQLSNQYFDNQDGTDSLLGWRYVLFAMDGTGTAFADYDGIVNALELPLSPDNYGFYQGVIYEDGVGEYTDTHSAVWYLPYASEGLSLSTNSEKYNAGVDAKVTIGVGSKSNILTTLSDYTLTLYDLELTTAYDACSGTLAKSSTTELLTMPGKIGYKYVFISLSGEGISYEHKRAKKVMCAVDLTDGEAKDTTETRVKGWLGGLGINDTSTIGIFVFFLILLFALPVMFAKSTPVKVVFALLSVLAFVIAVGYGWVNWGLLILMAVVFGANILKMILDVKRGR